MILNYTQIAECSIFNSLCSGINLISTHFCPRADASNLLLVIQRPCYYIQKCHFQKCQQSRKWELCHHLHSCHRKKNLPDMCKESRRQSCFQEQFSGFHTWHKSIHVLVSFHKDLIVLNFVCRRYNPLKGGGDGRLKTKTTTLRYRQILFPVHTYIIQVLQHRF